MVVATFVANFASVRTAEQKSVDTSDVVVFHDVDERWMQDDRSTTDFGPVIATRIGLPSMNKLADRWLQRLLCPLGVEPAAHDQVEGYTA